MTRIDPATMAEVYYKRSRYQSLADVREILTRHAHNARTVAYWKEVQDSLQELVMMGPPQTVKVHEDTLVRV